MQNQQLAAAPENTSGFEKTRRKKSAPTTDLIHGPVGKTLFSFSFPFMLSTLLQSLYSTTDTIIVGQFLGKNGLSAVSNGAQLMQMLYSLCIGFASAGQILIAQASGAENYRKLDHVISTLLVSETVLSIAVAVFSIFFCGTFINLLKVPEEAAKQTGYYIMICGGGMIFTGFYNAFSAIFRGMGDSRHPLIFVVIATVINVILDIVFIAAFHFDVAGAAAATIIGQAASVVFSICYLKAHAEEFHVHFSIRAIRPDAPSLKQLTVLGIPLAFQSAAVQISFLFVGRMINALGVTVSAAFGVMQKVRSIPHFITQGFGLGAASMMGQNFGAGRKDRVDLTVRWCILYTAVVCAVFAVLYLTIPDLLFRIYTQDGEVLSWARLCLIMLALELPANVVMPACNSLVSAQGFVKLSFIVGMLDAFVGRIFLCWLLGDAFHLGATGYFLGFVLGTYVTAAIVFIYYISGLWKKRKALVT